MHYQISRNGQTYGPYTLEDLERYLATGNVLPSDLAKSEDMADWLPVSQILGGAAPAAIPVAPVFSTPAFSTPGYADPAAAVYAQPAMQNFAPYVEPTMTELLFSFQGRIPRSKAWLGILIVYGGLFALALVLGGLAALHSRGLNILLGLIAILCFPFLIWMSLAVQVKRWHDLNITGWAVLISLVPFLGFLVNLIALGMIAGTPGPNSYGPNPLPAPYPVSYP
jgi:uncharacterized membrane protein YhaH (DUF805 family)